MKTREQIDAVTAAAAKRADELGQEAAVLKELAETKVLLQGANLTCEKIAALVGDHGQYRDLVEAVEAKLHELTSNAERWKMRYQLMQPMGR